jgi:predicted transcriptional regulator
MAHLTTKELLQETVDHLPADASVEEAMERLLFLAKIERGKAELQNGQLVDHNEVKRRIGL